MRILIPGGAGYKGVVLSKVLTDEGHAVTVIDHLKWGAWPLMSLIPKPNFKFVKGDVRDANLMRELLSKNDTVVNLAAVVGHPACDSAPLETRETNLEFVRWLSANLSKDQRLIQASTGSVYGSLDQVCTEESPCNPLSLYGSTKLQAEEPVLDFNGVVFRFATAYGVSPCARFDLLPAFLMYRALLDRSLVVYEGHAKRTFIDVWDMALAYLFAINNYERLQGTVFNVGDNTLNVTKIHVVNKVCEIIKREEGWDVAIFDKSDMKDKDARDYEVDYFKIQARGYRCGVRLDTSLEQTYQAAKAVIGSNPNPWRFS